MKRWALVVAVLYALAVVVLTAPAILLAFVSKAHWHEVIEVYRTWQYWLWPTVMGIGQVAFLAVPVRVASRRPVTKRALWPALLVGGLMMAALVLGASWSLIEFIFRDHQKSWMNWSALALAGVAWCFWAALFYRLSRTVSDMDLISHQR